MSTSSFGPYRIEELIGAGGMGEVHRAYDTVHDRMVALKRLPASVPDPQFRERFQREARIVARLRDPHVIPIHAYGELDGQLYLDMRLIDGVDLKHLVASGSLTPGRTISILTQVAAALDAAHADGLVHRDVKPSNVLVAAGDFAYLIDFGIAAHTAPQAPSLTSAGTLVGTPDYLAPERFSPDPIDGRADQYALACVLFECLTGRAPFTGGPLAATIAAHLHQPPPAASRRNPAIPPALDAVIARGMAKDPAQRFATAGELMAAAAAAGRSQVAQPPAPPLAPARSGPPTPTPSLPRRRTALAGAIAVVAIAVVATLVVAPRFGQESPGGGQRAELATAGSPTSEPIPTSTTVTTTSPTTSPTSSATRPPAGTETLIDELPEAYRGNSTCLLGTGEYTDDETVTEYVSCSASNVGNVTAGNRYMPEPSNAQFLRFADANAASEYFLREADELGLELDNTKVSCISVGYSGKQYGELTPGAADFLTCLRTDNGAWVIWVDRELAVVGLLTYQLPNASVNDMESLYLWWNTQIGF